jgi:hypothetical protein
VTPLARARILALALALAVASAGDAAADGERTPMFGGAVVGARSPDNQSDTLGIEVEAAWWYGRIGFALEGSMHWVLGGERERATVLGASARVRVHDSLLPSLLEPRDVELGLELHGIVARRWWEGDVAGAAADESPVGYGLGIAARLRGGSDHEFSALLAESRLFVRAVAFRPTGADAVARSMAPSGGGGAGELTILVGLGAAFGAGEARYLDRFRLRPPEPLTFPRYSR